MFHKSNKSATQGNTMTTTFAIGALKHIPHIPEFVKNDPFIRQYACELGNITHICPAYESMEYRYFVAFDRVKTVGTSKDRWDVYKANPCCARAGKKFGMKTSKEFRETIRKFWAQGWLQDESKQMKFINE